MSKIHPTFKRIIGQSIGKQRLSESIYSYEHGGSMMSPLILGEAGLGKTEISQALLDALKKLGIPTLHLKTPQELRSDGAEWVQFAEMVTTFPKYAIFMDEYHEVNGTLGQGPTIRTASVRSFLMKALDNTNQGKLINFYGQQIKFNRKNQTFILATNFPGKLDPSGAFQSRCDKVVLDLYNEDEMIDILNLMLEQNDLKPACDSTLRMIASCGRGTARPLSKIIQQIKMTFDSRGETKKTINKDDVIHSLVLAKMFPQGLQPFEIKILNRTHNPLRHAILKQMLPQVEAKEFGNSIAYLMSKELLVAVPRGVQVTPFGQRYIKETAARGFAVNI